MSTSEQPGGEISLSRAENNILKELMAPGAKINSLIPGKVDPDTLWTDLTILVKAQQVVTRTQRKLLPLIGRALLVFKSRPKLYEDRGYTLFADFKKRGVCGEMGLSTTDAYDALQLLEHFPGLTIEEYARVPRRSWQKLVQVTDHTKTDHQQLIEMAASESTDGFVKKLEEKGFINNGEATTVTISFVTTLDVSREIHEILGDPMVHAANQTSDRAVIILNALRESYSEWLNRGMEA